MSFARAAVIGLSLLAIAAAPSDLLDRERWRRRVVIVFAPGPDDARLLAQRRALGDPGMADRDVVGIEVVGSSPAGSPDAAWRAAYGVAADRFAVILIGKDGGEKRRTASVLSAADLFDAIDRMPMGRQERAARQAGQ